MANLVQLGDGPKDNGGTIRCRDRAWIDPLAVAVVQVEPPSDRDFEVVVSLASGSVVRVAADGCMEADAMAATFAAAVNAAREEKQP